MAEWQPGDKWNLRRTISGRISCASLASALCGNGEPHLARFWPKADQIIGRLLKGKWLSYRNLRQRRN